MVDFITISSFIALKRFILFHVCLARMAELVDALVSNTCAFTGMPVRLRLRVLKASEKSGAFSICIIDEKGIVRSQSTKVRLQLRVQKLFLAEGLFLFRFFIIKILLGVRPLRFDSGSGYKSSS